MNQTCDSLPEVIKRLKVEAVLEGELFTSPPLMKVVVAKLKGTKQDIPRAFKLTRDLVSNADLRHLRRVRDSENGQIECIIRKLDELEDQAKIVKDLEDRFSEEDLFEGYRSQLVPSKAPRTEHQWVACSQIWPCKYAKSNYLNQCIEGTVFEPAERLVLKTITGKLIEYLAGKDSHHSGSVIFRFDKIYGVGLVNEKVIRSNFTKHAPIVAIDAVAFNAGAGHWNHSLEEDATELHRSIQQQLDEHLGELGDHKMDPKFLPYLCTNYDVLVTEEPCMMCSMGLVQSRIRRLFYFDLKSLKIDTNLKSFCYDDGAIERFLVHRDKNLNHRFEAWRIKFSDR